MLALEVITLLAQQECIIIKVGEYGIQKITINNKEVYLGSFLNKEDAIAARRDAEERYFKEFSYNNSIGYNT